VTAYTTAAAGNWSATGTWTGGVIPANGDTVTLNHNVTVDVDTTIGTSPAENSGTFAISWGAATKKLTLAAGVTLTVRGDCQAVGNTTKNDVVLMLDGSTWEFDASQATSPTTQNYRFIGASAGNQYTVFRVQGTVSSRCTVRSNAGGGNAFFTRNAFAPAFYINAAYCDFLRIGDASNNFFDYYLGNTSSAELTFDNCSFDGVGLTTSSTAPAANADISITNCTWKNTAASKCLVVPGFTNAGTKVVSGNVFDKGVDFGQGAWVVSSARADGNLFMEGYVATAGVKWASTVGNLVRKTTQPALNVFGDLTYEYWLKDGAISNPHHLVLGTTAGLDIADCIFGCTNGDTAGDAMQPSSPPAARVYTVKRCILLPDHDQVVQPGKLLGVASSNAFVSCVAEHNTYISTMAGRNRHQLWRDLRGL
jgi:hypothetical protein